LPDGSVGLFYSFTLSAVNGTPPYQNWSIINNPGFLNMNGASLEGTPPGPPATYTFEIRVEDSASPPAFAVQQFQLTILQAGATVPALKIVTASQLPNAIEITPYSPIAFNATGGTPPYQWSNFVWLPAPTGKGPLPTMTFDLLSGVFSGTPDPGTVGTYAFQVTCSDSTVPTKYDTGTFFISVLPINDVVIISTPTQVGTVGAPPVGFQTAPYNSGQPFKFEADGGYKGPAGEEYYWAVMQGQLPPGLALDSSSGELSGIPITGGQFVFTLRASDGAFPPASGTAQFEIFVNPLIPTPLAITTGANLPQGDENNWYQKFLTAANGKPPYTWQLQAGSTLPLGMYLNGTTGELFGVIEIGQAAAPNQDFTFTMEVADSAVIPETATKTFTLNVKAFVAGQLTITTDENLPEAGVFNDYSVFLRSTGGLSADPFDPYLYSMAVLTPLPNGLVLESNGQIHGAPKVEGTFTFTVECYDGTGGVTDKSFTLQINGVSNGAGDTTEVKPGKSRTVTVPFWEACSVGGSTGQAGLLLLAVLGACALWLRRREA
jgi:MYXO-CTERM domain-containing protein